MVDKVIPTWLGRTSSPIYTKQPGAITGPFFHCSLAVQLQENTKTAAKDKQMLHLLPQIGQKMKNSILNTYLKPLNLVFLGHLPVFSADVRPTNQTAAAAAKWEDSNCGNPPKGFKYMWQIIQGVRKIQFTNGVTWGLYHGPIEPTCFRGFYANNLGF